ncbi:MAG: ATP-binding cassette domain-containing protein [Flavobacteriaceae bacterium]|nr:ATP-binding cassette domain-containing protein [Flavobacteriaceae bacterium]
MIQIEKLYKQFDGNYVLKDISTRFDVGKTNLIIGESGSGKTVLVKCILRLHQIDSGDIIYENQRLKDFDDEALIDLREQMGMVFQGSALFDSMTVEENISFPLKMHTKKSKDEILDLTERIIQRVNLLNSNKKFPNELSGGMQKRVAIARAVVSKPKYLFCDEPNSGLDPYTAMLIDNLIAEITQEYQITTIINTHDMNSVLEIGEKIIFLKGGVKNWEGTKHEIMNFSTQEVRDFLYSNKVFRELGKYVRPTQTE